MTPHERAWELACDRALCGLDPAEEAELAALAAQGFAPDPALDVAAAAIALAGVRIDQPLPRHLADRALSAVYAAASGAPAQPAQQQQAPALRVVRGGTVPMPHALPELPPAVAPSSGLAPVAPIHSWPGASPRSTRERRSAATWIGWLAAAACFALAIAGWWPRERRPVEIARRADIDVPRVELPPPGVAEQRDKLLADARDAVRVPWSSTADPAGKGESGEIVWSPSRQQGFMTFRALSTNDPTKSQYQLWIFDGSRDQRFPVDGGVFDVDTAKGEVVVPITAKIKVDDPKLFAVTVEQPGGVVVSKRERIVLAAKVGT